MKYALLIFVQLLFINCVSNNSSEKLPDIKAYYISVTGCKTHESNKGCAYFKLDNNHFDFGVISRKKKSESYNRSRIYKYRKGPSFNHKGRCFMRLPPCEISS